MIEEPGGGERTSEITRDVYEQADGDKPAIFGEAANPCLKSPIAF